MAEEFVDSDLNFECGVSVLSVEFVVLWTNEWDGFVGSFGAEDIAE
jgi:hypothetical protein